MKKIYLITLTLLCLNMGYSQSYEDEVQLIQSLYGKQKKELVTDFLELEASQKSDFWNIYDDYEMKRKKLGEKKFAIIWNYVNDYGEIKAKDAEMFMAEVIPLRKKSDELVDKYYYKIRSKIDPVVAVQFYQFENYIADIIRLELLEELFITKND